MSHKLTQSVFVLTFLLSLTAESCGGGYSGTTVNPPPPPLGPPPTAGNYLWESNGGADLWIGAIDANGVLGAPADAGGQAFSSIGNIPSFVTNPSKSILYVLDTSGTVIRIFAIIGPGVKLLETAHSPVFPPSPAGPFNAISIDPGGKSLYVLESPATILQFKIDAATNTLTNGASTKENADLREAVIDPSGKFLFANDLTGGRIFAYQIGATGSLSAVPGSPFTVPASGQPTQISLDHSGKFLYAPLFSGGVAAFSINSSTGALSDVAGSPFATSNIPSSLATSPSGDFLYVCNFSDGAIDGFKIDTNNGELNPILGSPFSTVAFPSNLVVDASGKYLFVSNYPNSNIFGFQIDPSTGALSSTPGSPFSSVPNPTLIRSLKLP